MEFRCSECDKLLAVMTDVKGEVEIKCPRCGCFNCYKA